MPCSDPRFQAAASRAAWLLPLLPGLLAVVLFGPQTAALLLPALIPADRPGRRLHVPGLVAALAGLVLAGVSGPLLVLPPAFAPLPAILALLGGVWRLRERLPPAGHARLGALLGSLDDLVFEFDADGRYLDVWTARPELLLMPREDLLRSDLSGVIGAAEGERVLQVLRAVLADGKVRDVEIDIRLPDGRARRMLGRLARVPATLPGGAATVSALVRDVTGRRRTEQALRDSEARLQTIVEALPVGAVHHHVPSGTVTLNRAAERLALRARRGAARRGLVRTPVRRTRRRSAGAVPRRSRARLRAGAHARRALRRRRAAPRAVRRLDGRRARGLGADRHHRPRTHAAAPAGDTGSGRCRRGCAVRDGRGRALRRREPGGLPAARLVARRTADDGRHRHRSACRRRPPAGSARADQPWRASAHRIRTPHAQRRVLSGGGGLDVDAVR